MNNRIGANSEGSGAQCSRSVAEGPSVYKLSVMNDLSFTSHIRNYADRNEITSFVIADPGSRV